MSNLMKIKQYVTEWVKANWIYQNKTGWDHKEAREFAAHLMEKCDIHHTWEFVNRDGVKRKEFLVRVGKPKFRGTVNYTLPSHSLLFNNLHPTDVRLVLSGDDVGSPIFDKLMQSQMKAWRPENSHQLMFQGSTQLRCDIPAHPHIGESGEPCLGGWAGAWSSAISGGHIPSLVNVAKSFLNTWTSNDAFWNINSVYGDYRRLPAWFKSGMSFGTYMANKQLWYTVATRDYKYSGNDGRIPRRGNFSRWLISNEHQGIGFASLYDFDNTWAPRLMDLYYGSVLNTYIEKDTEDELFKQTDRFFNFMNDIYYVSMDQIKTALGTPDPYNSALATEALTSRPQMYLTKPWYRSGSSMPPPTQLIKRCIDDGKHKCTTRSNDDETSIDWTQIFAYQRIVNNVTGDRFKRAIDEDTAKKDIAWYLGRMQDDLFVPFEAMRTFISLYDGDSSFLSESDSYKQTQGLINFVRGFKEDMNKGETLTKYCDHFTSIGIENYTKAIHNYSSGRLLNATDKHKRIKVRDTHFGDDSEQNQLSAF